MEAILHFPTATSELAIGVGVWGGGLSLVLLILHDNTATGGWNECAMGGGGGKGGKGGGGWVFKTKKKKKTTNDPIKH